MVEAVPEDRDLVVRYQYFAASVFWRSSVVRWRFDGRIISTSSLGPYEEAFRRYLLDDTSFPECASLHIIVSSDDEPDNVLTFPDLVRCKERIRHKLYIPGVMFALFVGNTNPDLREQRALGSVSGRVFLSSIRHEDDWFSKSVIGMFLQAKSRIR